MLKLVLLGLIIGAALAAPGFLHGPVIAAPSLYPEPIPVIKTILPATSYATITKVHVAHPPPIIKTILAPQPILKSYISDPWGHGLYH